MPEEFQKFTERARKVLTLAQEEAHRFNHNYIGTEHLLLGLLREEGGVAARVLRNMGVDLVKARAAVEFIVGRGDSMIVGEMRLTPRAKRVIALANREAWKLHHHYIGTEHLLLGLLKEGQGIAAGVLASLGVPLPEVRQQILSVIGQGGAFVGTGGIVMEPKTEPAPLGDLLRVIPIVQTQAVGDVRVTLLSLESYAHGFIIHDRATISDQTAPHPERMAQLGSLDFDISDDRGGHYHGRMQHGRTDGFAWYFGADYRPGIDPEARELRVRVRGGGLPRPPEPAGGQQAAEPYPWLLTFSIPLHPEGR